MPSCQNLHTCSAAQVMQQLDTAEAQAVAGEAAGAELSLVVDGRALGVLLADAAVKKRLLALGTSCAAVVCCRVSPLQKALVTRLVSAFVQGLGLIRATCTWQSEFVSQLTTFPAARDACLAESSLVNK